MIYLLIAALLAASLLILHVLNQWLSKPMFRELTRFPGNEAAIDRHMAARKLNPQLFLPTHASESRIVNSRLQAKLLQSAPVLPMRRA